MVTILGTWLWWLEDGPVISAYAGTCNCHALSAGDQGAVRRRHTSRLISVTSGGFGKASAVTAAVPYSASLRPRLI